MAQIITYCTRVPVNYQLSVVAFHAGFLAVAEETVTVDVVSSTEDALFHDMLVRDTLFRNKCDLSAGPAPVNGSHLIVGRFGRPAVFL